MHRDVYVDLSRHLLSFLAISRTVVYLKISGISILDSVKCAKLREKVKRGASLLLSTWGSMRTEPCSPPSVTKNELGKVNSQMPSNEAKGRPPELMLLCGLNETQENQGESEKLKGSLAGTF